MQPLESLPVVFRVLPPLQPGALGQLLATHVHFVQPAEFFPLFFSVFPLPQLGVEGQLVVVEPVPVPVEEPPEEELPEEELEDEDPPEELPLPEEEEPLDDVGFFATQL